MNFPKSAGDAQRTLSGFHSSKQLEEGRKEAAVPVIAHGMGQGEKSEHVLLHGETQMMDSEAEALVPWNPREHS